MISAWRLHPLHACPLSAWQQTCKSAAAHLLTSLCQVYLILELGNAVTCGCQAILPHEVHRRQLWHGVLDAGIHEQQAQTRHEHT